MTLLREIWLCIKPGIEDRAHSLRIRMWRRIKLLHELFLVKTGKLILPTCATGLKDPLNQLHADGSVKSWEENFPPPLFRDTEYGIVEDIE